MSPIPGFRFFLISFTFFFSSVSAQKYFQQEVNYKINVRLDDKNHELFADETIEYINHSPNELTFIYMHLWPNAYKNDSSALAKQLLENNETSFYFSSEKDKGYIDQIDFKINGNSVKWELDSKDADICKIILNQPLKSNEKLIITTPFHVKIPLGIFSRLGHMGESYQITQWYPKPAVYDMNGWKQMPYLNQGEFYSEFGSFDVSITLPKNYVVGATGDLVDGESELQWLEAKVKETESISTFPKNDSFPVSDPETKTLHYTQNKVHDFAWFADKRFHVLKGETELPHTKRKITTWAMFTNSEANLWKNSISYINDAVYYYSLWNGDYPYNQVTAADGALSAGTGMEYPNVTIIGKSGSSFGLETVIMHEVGHNWFYGILGSNERIHPWLDEGINSFYENRYIETKYPDATLIGGYSDSRLATRLDLTRYKHKKQYELAYLWNAAKNEDQPIELPAYDYTNFNYGGIVYAKTAIVFDYLMAYIGEKKMDEAMKQYFETWKFKHPQPKDLRQILESVSGKNLSWFFDDMILSTKKLDYKIVSFKKFDNGSYDIIVKNTGEIKAPVAICGIKNNKLKAIVWYDGFEGTALLGFPPDHYDYFKIDFSLDMPEINRNNNTIRTKGMMKKTEPFKLQLFGSIDHPDKTQLFYTPVIGWNNYNKTMLGVALYNNILPQKKFEYLLMPLYATENKDLTGHGEINLNITPNNKIFQQVTARLSADKYLYDFDLFTLNFYKVVPELTFKFKKKNARSSLLNEISCRTLNITEERKMATFNDMRAFTGYKKKTVTSLINQMKYTLKNNRVINPFQMLIDLQQGKDFLKTSLQANYQITFKEKSKSIDIRIFAGTFLLNNINKNSTSNNIQDLRFRMSGQTGYQDYLYDNVFLGRSERDGVFSRQFTETDGAFKVYTLFGQTNEWLVSLNVKSSLPEKIPFKVYADIGTAANGLLGEKFLYDAGIDIPIMKNVFEIYFPVTMSPIIKEQITDYTTEKNYFKKALKTVRFTLNLNLVNPFHFIRNFSL